MAGGTTLHDELELRISRYEWPELAASLGERGYARLPGLLDADECSELIRLYDQPDHFRSSVEMSAHAFGKGSYRYFAYPLPALVAALRELLYPPLRVIAKRWHEQLGVAVRYPASLSGFLESCHAAGQTRPTPLLLRYGVDGYNRMHQDVYGEIAFPLQLACLLSPPRATAATAGAPDRAGFSGGEFLISEHRPRMQARIEAIRLEAGEAILFANAIRPVRSARGYARAQMRHGLNRIDAGERVALGNHLSRRNVTEQEASPALRIPVRQALSTGNRPDLGLRLHQLRDRHRQHAVLVGCRDLAFGDLARESEPTLEAQGGLRLVLLALLVVRICVPAQPPDVEDSAIDGDFEILCIDAGDFRGNPVFGLQLARPELRVEPTRNARSRGQTASRRKASGLCERQRSQPEAAHRSSTNRSKRSAAGRRGRGRCIRVASAIPLPPAVREPSRSCLASHQSLCAPRIAIFPGVGAVPIDPHP